MSAPIVAITGGIASGKSAAGRMFEELGRTLIDADAVARELVEPGQPALAEIRACFGEGVLLPDGRLDRRALRRRVFDDPDARRKLERILHPRIREVLRARSLAASGPYVLVAVPLLVESQGYDWVERILLIDVPEALQLARVMERDRIGPAEARAVLAAQASRAARWAVATDVIVNDGSLADLRRMVLALDLRWRAGLRRAS
ncbi:MAG: dephospho-CoA kinase [Lysobacteraceae bacterium]|nr:MAG: dephospho-CoA kinase [Xanthomonadaceae bacterium]